MSADKTMILDTSPEAAQLKTVTGWVSRDGFFYGAGPQGEATARYAGCTHRACQACGALTEKLYTHCPACREKRDLARYLARPRKEWDGVSMLYSDARDKYFNDMEAVRDELLEGETLEDLRLLICEPNRGRRLCEDHFADDLAEDGDLPDELVQAIEAFNAVLAKQPPLSWSPGKFALQLPSATRADLEAGKRLRHRGDNGLYFKDAEGRYWAKGGDRFGNNPDESCTLSPVEVAGLFDPADPYGFELEEDQTQ